MAVPDLVLDTSLRDWVLLPITFVMFLVGLLRHGGTVLMQPKPAKVDLKTIKQQQYLQYGSTLRSSFYALLPEAFQTRQSYYAENFKAGKYVAEPKDPNSPPQNPLTDPKGMDTMVGMVKNQIMVFVPQTLMMGWINAFFAGFVLMKLPFPLTVQFKEMLQTGVATRDLDVRWVSSVSWYIVNLVGLQPIHALVLGSGNQAGGVAAMGASNPMAMMQPGVDYGKLFLAEAENLTLINHETVLDGVEERLIKRYK